MGPDDIIYNINGTSAAVASANATAHSSNQSAITIPASFTYNGVEYSVTSMNDDAFRGTPITSVTINAPLTYIPANAFLDCTGLESVKLPETLTVIRGSAFAGCI